MATSGQLHYKNLTNVVDLAQSGYHYFIENNLLSPWCSYIIAQFALNNDRSLAKRGNQNP